MIDESQIEWLLNGERAEADVLNRPLRQLVSATNDAISNLGNDTTPLIEERYDDIFEVIKDGNGFTRERDAQLIFDAGNATVSIAPGAGKSTWFYYHKGRKIESSETKTYTLSALEKANGGFYLSFNKEGDLVNTGSRPDFFDTTLCFYVHYAHGEFIIEGDERHAADRDTAWHHSHHREDGMVVYTLGTVGWVADDATKVGIEITTTHVADEDLQHLIKHSPTGEEPFSQILEGSQDTVRIPTLYYDGNIRYLANKKLPWVADALKYNDGVTLKDVPNGKFVNYFLVATHCQKYPIKLIMGRKLFDSDHETVDETLESLGLNFPEMALLYRIAIERDNSLSTVGKCKLKSVQQAASKITFESAAGSAGSGLSNHAQLLGRTDDNAHPISAITGLDTVLGNKVDKANIVQESGTSATNVMSQKAVTAAITGLDTVLGNKVDKSQVVQVTGTSATNVMSQKAVTDTINTKTTSLRENIKVTVGAGGDFTTINAAVLHLSRFTPDLGVTAEVELRRGFVMREQLLVKGLDLGWITITGVDAETVINEPSLTMVLVDDTRPAFGVISGTLPTIGQLFRFSSKGNTANVRCGVMAHSAGRATVLEGCGVKNAGSTGILASNGSTIDARGAIASGAGDIGIDAYQVSTISANGVDARNAGKSGIEASNGSTIDARGAIASGAGVFGISAAYSSTINAAGVDARNAGDTGIYVYSGSTVNAESATGTLFQTKNTVTADGIIFRP